jgi:hypothetical protein
MPQEGSAVTRMARKRIYMVLGVFIGLADIKITLINLQLLSSICNRGRGIYRKGSKGFLFEEWRKWVVYGIPRST